MFDELVDKQGVANSLLGLGSIYAQSCQWEKATDHYSRCLEIQKELEDASGMITPLAV